MTVPHVLISTTVNSQAVPYRASLSGYQHKSVRDTETPTSTTPTCLHTRPRPLTIRLVSTARRRSLLVKNTDPTTIGCATGGSVAGAGGSNGNTAPRGRKFHPSLLLSWPAGRVEAGGGGGRKLNEAFPALLPVSKAGVQAVERCWRTCRADDADVCGEMAPSLCWVGGGTRGTRECWCAGLTCAVACPRAADAANGGGGGERGTERG